jgi:hypothetical protein
MVVDNGCKGCLAELRFRDVVATEIAESLGRFVMMIVGASIQGSCEVWRAIILEDGIPRGTRACVRRRRGECGEGLDSILCCVMYQLLVQLYSHPKLLSSEFRTPRISELNSACPVRSRVQASPICGGVLCSLSRLQYHPMLR